MTFTEAAVEVLRLVGKPLHYKKITEVAIERNLLSHVGKTPEVTMSSRLATMVKRDRGEVPIIKVKPGVFGLREFSEEQLADLSGDVDELPEAEVTENENGKPEEAALEASASPSPTPSLSPSGNGEAAEVQARPSIVVPRKPLPGADVFPEEEDDDEPILGGPDDDDDDDDEEEGTAEAGEAGQAGESRSSRRRRKRRRRGGPEEGEAEAAPRPPEREAAAPREARDRPEGRDARNGRRDERNARRDEQRRDRQGRDRDAREARDGRDRDARDGRDRDARDNRDRDERRNELVLDMSREPADGDLLGKELGDAVASVLSQSGPRGMPAIRVAEMLVRKGRLAGDPSALLPTVMAAVRADAARRRHEPRPRFKVEGSTLVLTDFLLPHDVVRAEQDVLRAASQQRDRVRRAFLRKVSELPAAGLAELVATWLNAEGVVGLRAVRRPTTGPGELHLAGTLRRGSEEVRIAVIVCRDGRELGREKVIEARGALHYYGNASTAWLITLGAVMSGAREEAAAPASTPVALFDGLGLACAMERVAVGIGVQQVSIASLDFELLEVLRGSGARERERDDGRREARDDGRREGRDEGRRDGRDRQRERDRGDRERPRLVLERPGPRPEGEEGEEPEEAQAEPQAVEGEGGHEDEAQAAAPEQQEPGGEGAGEAREGARRRRRRRRRKGGRGAEGQAAGAATENEGAESAEEADDDDEDADASGEEVALAGEAPNGVYDDAEERSGREADDDSDEDDAVDAESRRGRDDEDDADYPHAEDDADARDRARDDTDDEETAEQRDEDARRHEHDDED